MFNVYRDTPWQLVILFFIFISHFQLGKKEQLIIEICFKKCLMINELEIRPFYNLDMKLEKLKYFRFVFDPLLFLV